VLRKCEAIVFFFATVLPIVLERALVCRVFQDRVKALASNPPFTDVGEWTGTALLQAWLLGAIFVVVYPAVTFIITRVIWTNQMFSRTWRAFVRLRHWTIAMIVMQELVLFLNRAFAS
jgi:hypothetical protein